MGQQFQIHQTMTPSEALAFHRSWKFARVHYHPSLSLPSLLFCQPNTVLSPPAPQSDPSYTYWQDQNQDQGTFTTNILEIWSIAQCRAGQCNAKQCSVCLVCLVQNGSELHSAVQLWLIQLRILCTRRAGWGIRLLAVSISGYLHVFNIILLN